MTPEEQIARGKQAAEELKLLGPVAEALERAYFEKYLDVLKREPWADNKLKSLGFATTLVRTIEAEIKLAVANGLHEEALKKSAAKISEMTPERQRWAQAAGMLGLR